MGYKAFKILFLEDDPSGREVGVFNLTRAIVALRIKITVFFEVSDYSSPQKHWRAPWQRRRAPGAGF